MMNSTNSGTDHEIWKSEAVKVLENLESVENSLSQLIEDSAGGRYGFITREWGFSTPNGLGRPLGGKFEPWERKLSEVKTFFWPLEAYDYMERLHTPDDDNKKAPAALPPEGERLPGNLPLHKFLQEPPVPSVELDEATDLDDFRTAAKIFLLLGTLSHLSGNSAPDPKTTPLPDWIEIPLLQAAKRLQIQPTLTNFFVTLENWQWQPSPAAPPIDQKKDLKDNAEEIARILLAKCEVKDRRYRITLYKDCFVGEQAIDVLVDHGFASTREQAVHIGRGINEAFQLFTHVTNDHLLKDKRLFYRFRKKWRRKQMKLAFPVQGAAMQSPDQRGTHDADAEDDKDMNVRIFGDPVAKFARAVSGSFSVRSGDDGELMGTLAKQEAVDGSSTGNQLLRGEQDGEAAAFAAMRSVSVKNRRYRLKSYKNCFIGCQLIDVLVEHECASTRLGALRLAHDLNRRYHLFNHVCNDHEIKDEHLFYRFTPKFSQMIATPTKDSLHGHNGKSPHSNRDPGGDNEVPPPAPTQLDRSTSIDTVSSAAEADFGFLEETKEFRYDNIEMLYPAFGNNHERSNQLIPACMGYALRALPFTVIDILGTMRDLLEARLNNADTVSSSSDDLDDAIQRLSDLLFQVAFSLSRCKEQFQLMSTDATKRTFNSKHISIRQTQPLANGVVVAGKRRKGNTGTQFPYFHLLDWLLGRYMGIDGGQDDGHGLISKFSAVDDSYPPPQREYIQRLSALCSSSTLRGFLDVIGRPQRVMTAYSYLLESYAGEGGILKAHCSKLFSYLHNDVQTSSSGTAYAGLEGERTLSVAERNHQFANTMFGHMRKAMDERWCLRVAPLMTEVEKIVYSTSESGGFTTVALHFGKSGLRYDYGDVVRVLLPNSSKASLAWFKSLSTGGNDFLKLCDMPPDSKNGWGWKELWEALGWEAEDQGVPLETIAPYIEEARVTDDTGRSRWVQNPLDLCGTEEERMFAVPPKIEMARIASLVPVSPRIYSVSGVETDRVFLLVSKPSDGGATRHHGYERMADTRVQHVHCSFAPSTHFLIPPVGINLVCIASGTGISPFVGLADNIGSRQGSFTIAHQCKSSDLFLSNCQTWLDFTALNPGAVVFGYISGDRSRRNCPMRYTIANGMFEETVLLGRHSSSAYYFQCQNFRNRLEEVYKRDGLNLAYCCGGVKSAIDPLKNIVKENSWNYEFTVESYAVTSSLTSGENDFSCLIGDSSIDLDSVSHVHEGGDQILHQVHKVALERHSGDSESGSCPASSSDLSDLFWSLHPHAYNLHRCLRAPRDADFEAYSGFLKRQQASTSLGKKPE